MNSTLIGVVLCVCGCLGLQALAPAASVMEGVELLRAGDLERGIATLSAAVEADPANPAGVFWLGWAQLRAGKYAEAVVTLSRAKELSPQSAEVRYWLGMALEGCGKLLAARAEYEAALAADPNHASAREALVRVKAASGLGDWVYTGPLPPFIAGGTRVRMEPGGLPVEMGEVDLLSGNVYDYAFGDAPTDWFAGSGLWAITNRWDCSPQWSWEGGVAERGAAVLWNKREFAGDVTVEGYFGFKMGTGSNSSYKNPNDLNIIIHGDGANPSSGYCFMVGANRNTETRIMKGTRVLASTSEPKALLPMFEDGFPSSYEFHRKWWSIRARKRGTRLQLYLDERLVAEADDPEPPGGGHVGLWAYNNSIVVSRVKIYYQAENAQRGPIPGMAAIRRPVRRVSDPGFGLVCTSHPSVQHDFEADLGGCEPRSQQDPVVVSLVEPGAEGRGHCMAVTNSISGGTFGVRLVPGPFDLKELPRLSFDYRLPAEEPVKVNLYLMIAGRLAEIVFSGPPAGTPLARQIGAIADVTADGQWHHAEFDLLGAAQTYLGPLSSSKASDLWIGNLCEDDYLLAGFGANRLGATYYLDNVVLEKPGPRAIRLAISPREGANLQGYSVLVDGGPLTEAPEVVTTTEPSVAVTADGEGVWYAHVKGLRAEGGWTPTVHYRVRVDETAPQVATVEPAAGSTLHDEMVRATLVDPGGAGVDVSTLKVTVDGQAVPVDGRAVEWEPGSGVLAIDPRWVIAGPQDGSEVKLAVGPVADTAGNVMGAPQEWRYRIAFADDHVPPPAPRLEVGSAGYLVDEDFEHSVGDFSGYGGAGAAEVSLDDSTAASGRRSLRLYNPAGGGSFGVYVQKKPFDAGKYRIISFDYKVPRRLRADLAVFVNGAWKAIQFKDTDHDFPYIGKVPNVVDDNQWHHAEINLYEMLRRDDPHARSYVVRQFVIADWKWRANAEGQTYHLDNFQIIPVVSAAQGLAAKWRVPDISGTFGLSWVVSNDASVEVPREVRTAGASGTLEDVPATDGWLKARVRDGAGNWSETASRRLLVDNDPPLATAVGPANGQTAATSQVELNVIDPGLAGVDPSSLVLSVNGTDYTLENPSLTFKADSGALVWNCENVTPQPVVFADRARVEVKLKAAADYAGNPAPHLPEWWWVMDYSQDKIPPVVASVDSSTHDTLLCDTFEAGPGEWRNMGGASGALVEVDTTQAASGAACLKLTQQQAGGSMAAYVTMRPFSAVKHPILSFDYKLQPNVKLDFIAHMADGNEYAVAFSDNPTGAQGAISGVVADGTWRHAWVDLQAILKARYPQGAIQVSYLYVSDRNKLENPAGACAWFDNFIIGALGQTAPVLRWKATDTTGIVAYSFALDQDPTTIPDEVSEGLARTYRYPGALKPGIYFFHVRAQDGAGSWGPPSHYALLHQRAG